MGLSSPSANSVEQPLRPARGTYERVFGQGWRSKSSSGNNDLQRISCKTVLDVTFTLERHVASPECSCHKNHQHAAVTASCDVCGSTTGKSGRKIRNNGSMTNGAQFGQGLRGEGKGGNAICMRAHNVIHSCEPSHSSIVQRNPVGCDGVCTPSSTQKQEAHTWLQLT
jgi:hypothetical protein